MDKQIQKNFWYKSNIIIPLRGFCKVYELENFTKAATNLFLSQSALSRQIQAIERELNIQLFYKENGRIKPTNDGTFLYNLVKPKIQSIDSVYEYFNSRSTEDFNKKIRISGHHTAVTYIIPRCIKEYRDVYKDSETEFIIKNLDLNKALNELDNNKIDIAIYPIKNINNKQYNLTSLFTLKPTIIMHKQNELADKNDKNISLKDLKRQNVLFIDEDKIMPIFIDICKEHNIGGNIKFVNSDWETVRNYLRFNLGIHFYSDIFDLFEEVKEPNLISKDMSHIFPKIKTCAITSHSNIFSNAKLKFMDILSNIKNSTENH